MASVFQKIIALTLVATMAVSAFVHPAFALQYTGTDSYTSGKYNQKLRQVKLTGDPRTDIVAVARSQVGYQEGNSEDQLSGEVYGSDNFTEYGHWYDLQNMWCAIFVSWCAAVAGISTDVVPSHSYTPDGLSWFADRGVAYSRADIQSRKYTPMPGDVIYFKSTRNANITNHVGIVTGYANNRIYTVEGNIGAPGQLTDGGMVAELSYPISNTFIVYVCSPDYERGGMSILPDAEARQEAWRRESLRQAVMTLEAGEGQTYDAVCTGQSGTVTLGCGQWYGAQAVQLLRQIWAEDPTVFSAADAAALLGSDGLPLLNERQCGILRHALASEAGVRIQNEWMDRSLQGWMNRAGALGVTDQDSLILCAAIYQLRGTLSAERIIQRVGDAPTKEAVLNVVKDLEPGLYRSCCLLVE